MRLIDAEDFKKRLYEIAMNGGNLTWDEYYRIASALDNQLIAYDVDEVINAIDNTVPGITNMQIMMIQDIVKSGGIKCNQ